MSTVDDHSDNCSPQEPDREVSRLGFIWSPANIGLAVFLAVECAVGLYVVTSFEGNDRPDAPLWELGLDVVLWIVVGTVLVFNTIRRLPPLESDTRWWVWLICTVCTVRFLAFDYTDETRTALWILIGLNLLADTSLIALGRSFSLMPARRTIRVGWMYRFVRHPIYSAYMLIDAIYLSLLPSVQNFAVVYAGAILFAWRAVLEERLLRNDPRYREYAERVRWRFLPFVY